MANQLRDSNRPVKRKTKIKLARRLAKPYQRSVPKPVKDAAKSAKAVRHKIAPDLEVASAPWTEDEVDQLSHYQRSEMQPMTCPDHPSVKLEPSAVGLSCTECSFLKRDCPTFILNGGWRKFMRQVR